MQAEIDLLIIVVVAGAAWLSFNKLVVIFANGLDDFLSGDFGGGVGGVSTPVPPMKFTSTSPPEPPKQPISSSSTLLTQDHTEYNARKNAIYIDKARQSEFMKVLDKIESRLTE